MFFIIIFILVLTIKKTIVYYTKKTDKYTVYSTLSVLRLIIIYYHGNGVCGCQEACHPLVTGPESQSGAAASPAQIDRLLFLANI